MKRALLAGLVGLALLAPALPAAAAAPIALGPADVPALLAAPAQGVKIIAIWSLDCAYCEDNLAALAQYQRQQKNVDLVFVATDPVSAQPALTARLTKAGLGAVPSRAYADATPDRLNFLVDPTWGGETPRTLVIRADGTRRSYSGALDAVRITTLTR